MSLVVGDRLGLEMQELIDRLPVGRRGGLDAAEACRHPAPFSQARERVGFQVDLCADVVCQQVDVVKFLKQAELGCKGVADR